MASGVSLRDPGQAWDRAAENGAADSSLDPRMVLPVGLYSSMYATCNARALMDFLS